MVVFGKTLDNFGWIFHDFCSCYHDFNDYFIWANSIVCFKFERFDLSFCCRNFNTRSFTYFPLFPFPFPIFKPSSFQLSIADWPFHPHVGLAGCARRVSIRPACRGRRRVKRTLKILSSFKAPYQPHIPPGQPEKSVQRPAGPRAPPPDPSG